MFITYVDAVAKRLIGLIIKYKLLLGLIENALCPNVLYMSFPAVIARCPSYSRIELCLIEVNSKC
jgi:hypothetical protein